MNVWGPHNRKWGINNWLLTAYKIIIKKKKAMWKVEIGSNHYLLKITVNGCKGKYIHTTNEQYKDKNDWKRTHKELKGRLVEADTSRIFNIWIVYII